jgi:erythromycin esterase
MKLAWAHHGLPGRIAWLALMAAGWPVAAWTQGQSLDRYLRPIEERRQEDARQLQLWLRANAQPLGTSRTELGPLAERLTRAQVVGLGEVTHGSHEDMAFKASLIRSMVAQQGVQMLALEANRSVGKRLQQFVAPNSTETDVQAALRDSGIYTIYRCEALGDLLLWLQGWNRTAVQPVQVVGIDVQDPGRDARAALAGLAQRDSTRAEGLGQALDELRQDSLPPVGQLFAQASRSQWQRWLDTAQALETALLEVDAETDALDAAYALRMALHSFEFDVGTATLPADLPPEAFTRRDAAMAERLLRARRHAERTVLWAHDAHVASNGYDMFAAQAPTVGQILRHRLGTPGYQSLNFSYRQASFHAHGLQANGAPDFKGPFKLWRVTAGSGSLGAAMAAAVPHSFWVDLDALPADRWALSFRMEPYRRLAFGDGVSPELMASSDVSWPLGYGTDILVHLDTLTPSRLYGARQAPASEKEKEKEKAPGGAFSVASPP